MSMHTLADANAVIDLLHDLNEQGVWPSVAFVDARGVTGVAYGIDLGDEMGTAYLTDPGDERYVERDGEPGAESYVSDFERDIADLRGPILALAADVENRRDNA